MADTPRIYVASLSDYNAGRLHGVWIDVDDIEDVQQAIAEMLKASPEPGAEEYAIHDFEGFGDYRLSEYESLNAVVKLAVGIEQHGLAYAAYCGYHGQIMDYEAFEDAFRGEWDSVKDYAEDYIDQTGLLDGAPELFATYFDYQRFARDLEMELVVCATEGHGVYIFDQG